MSASTEKKLRQAAREAGTDKKTNALEKEAKERAKSKRRWTIGTTAVIVLIVLVLLLNSGLVYRSTAFTVGDRNYSTSEVSYRYANQYNYFANQYGSYASMFGLDTSNGIKGLDKQDCPIAEGSWKDYFLDAAKNELIQSSALLGYAAENGITLTEEELAQIDASFDGIDETAKLYGFGSADKMLAANYGTGVTVDMVREASREASLADKASTALAESFTYSDEELEAQYQSYNGSRDYFDYAYVYVTAEKVETTGEDGETVSAPTEETLAAAGKTADAIAAAYGKAKGEPDARLTEAAEAEGESASVQRNASGSSLFAASAWLMDASRKAGDITVEADSAGNGYYVVVFLSRNDNHYNTASVRHILVKAEADADGKYTDEAKAAAKARAEEILAEFNAGDKSEESFAALAEQYSEDAGSNTNGGLYENIAKGQMVSEFDAFCFEGHKPGDTGIVYGESASYAGYHVMYYVGEGGLYSNYLAENDLRSGDVQAWLDEKAEAIPTKEGFGMKFVG